MQNGVGRELRSTGGGGWETPPPTTLPITMKKLPPRHPMRRSIDHLLEKPAIHWDKHGTPLFWLK